MNSLLASVRKTLAFTPAGLSLLHFPLGYEATSAPSTTAKSVDRFQVTYLGRLNWMSKADLLVIPRLLDCLPDGHRIRATIAGATDNKHYLPLLQQHCDSPRISILQNLPDAEKHHLLVESHILFSPSDNYQETFGLTVIEAMHHGCVPVVSDFNGYRDLVRDNVNGVLLRTYAAKVPKKLWDVQILMPDTLYHS
jgi:glycosyltransferase involved in cell wall biosynthesis